MATRTQREAMQNMINTMTYGVEIEMTGITRESAARVTASLLGNGARVDYAGGSYGKYKVTDIRKYEIILGSIPFTVLLEHPLKEELKACTNLHEKVGMLEKIYIENYI